MTAKEYLSQAKHLDLRINAKIQQMSSLHELATRATAVLSDMPGSHNHEVSTMAVTVDKMIDLENEINSDIDALVDLKRNISTVINAVSNAEYQTVLEKRYLCFQSWEIIASEMQYDIRWLYRLHGKALEEIQKQLNKNVGSSTRH